MEKADCIQQTVDRNTSIKGEGSEGSDGESRESFCHLGEFLHHHEQNVDRSMNIKGASGATSDRNEHVVGHWRRS